VVNEKSANIYGFRYLPSGQLSPLPGQAPGGRALSSPFPNTVAAQIGFTPDGRQLVVTERGLPKQSGVIDTFQVNADGLAGPAQAHTGVGYVDPNPFGFAFDNAGHLLVTSPGYVAAPGDGPPPIPQVFDPTQFNGTTASYNLSSSGTLTLTSNVPSRGRGACWVVVSKDGKYAFVTNTLSDTIPNIFTGKGGVTRYAVASDGTLSYLGQVDTSPGAPGDMAVSPDGQFLYVLTPTVLGPDTSHIDVYRIGAGGSLTLVASPDSLRHSVSGLGVS
jgi:6-phosphogluconolactonase (cycloisomerase 2 family)